MILLAENNHLISEQLRDALADVEVRFAKELQSDLPCVNKLVQHVERYRGKMLRPTLVLLAGVASHPNQSINDAHRVIATVVEMIHMATLVHDDILDEADMRRKGSTINHLAGNEAAVMLGDYLISHAYHLCSSLEQPAISRELASTTNVVCEGELLQLHHRHDWSLDLETYHAIIDRKTASLVGLCCKLGAELSQADAATVQGLETYGRKVGAAFQIVDDILDLTGDPQVVGKTLGCDLHKGKLTLPMILALKKLDGQQRSFLIAFLEQLRTNSLTCDAQRMKEIQTLLESCDVLTESKKQAQTLIQDAKQALIQVLPESDARKTLEIMADTVLTRRY